MIRSESEDIEDIALHLWRLDRREEGYYPVNPFSPAQDSIDQLCKKSLVNILKWMPFKGLIEKDVGIGICGFNSVQDLKG